MWFKINPVGRIPISIVNTAQSWMNSTHTLNHSGSLSPDDRKPIEKGKSTELRQWQVSSQCLVLLPLGQVSMFLVSRTECKENTIGMVALDVGMEVNALPELIQLRIPGDFLDVQVVVGIYFGVLITSRFLLLISYPHLRPYSRVLF
ncbi:hypothetical protein B0H17DRAFT_1137766 [Mycena rosella]|uniref:Uncharacterized protein n=1 Tax=Mycena rosella TaxID=1033263 RepID=A0AAD7GEG6_MYCRO|nr:hypothetical protein B0H17DRAFT_1137766 [Mycena rosella]